MRVTIKTIIQTHRKFGNVSLTASTLGISRPTVYRWLSRGQRLYSPGHRYQGVFRHSTRPKTIHYKATPRQKSEIVSLFDNEHLGSRKIKAVLGLKLSYRTIHRILLAKGRISKQVNHRRPLFQNGACMRPANTKDLGFLQMDTKHVTPELSGLTYTVYEYGAIDILSRYKLAILLPDISDESAALALEFFLKWFPFPIKYVQTDNGLEFQRSFRFACEKHKINHYHIHKNSSNENAVIERSFRTDQDEFYYWLERPTLHIGDLNTKLQKFILKYNTWRPHQSLDYQTPQQVVTHYLQLSNL